MPLITDFEEIYIDDDTGLICLECKEKDEGVVISSYTLMSETMEGIRLKIKAIVARNVAITTFEITQPS